MKLKITLLWLLVVSNTFAQVVEIPDPNLREAIREALELPANAEPITQQEMLTLERLDAGGDRGITDLTGLEYATNLRRLELYHNPISDISAFAHLTNLQGFNFWGCQISDISPLHNLISLESIVLGNNQIADITPLAGLTRLTTLQLDRNQIVDFSPLANLVNLRSLRINENLGIDFTFLANLNLTHLQYDQVCDMLPLGPSVRERIENRSFPSVFAAWGGVGWSPIINRPDLSDEEHLALHDLYWSSSFMLEWDRTPTESTHGVATALAGNLANAHQLRDTRLAQNPNMVFLVEVRIHNHFTPEAFPPNSNFWFRGAGNQIVQNSHEQFMIDFIKPEVQDLLIKRILLLHNVGFMMA